MVQNIYPGVLKGVTFDECHCVQCEMCYPGVLKWVDLLHVMCCFLKGLERSPKFTVWMVLKEIM